jgi:hypothetical protein
MIRRLSARPFGRAPALAVVSLLALGAGAGLPSARSGERYTLAGPSLAVYDLAGEVVIEPAANGDLAVLVSRGGADAARLQIESGPIAGVATLRVVFPDSRVVYREPGSWGDRIQVGDDGRFGDEAASHSAAGRHSVLVSGRGPGLEAHADLRIRVPAGRRFALYLGAGRATVTNVDGDLCVSVASAAVTTEHTRGDLRIDSGSGELRVRDARGNVALDTGSGGALVRGLRGERLRLDTGSGGVQVIDAEVGSLVADTGSGSVEITDVRSPEMSLDSGSGSMRLSLLSGSGDVTLGVPGDLGAAFDIETGSGGVRIQAPHTIESRDEDHVRGRFGDGRGRIHIESGSGGVRILPRAVSESHLEGGIGSLLHFAFA